MCGCGLLRLFLEQLSLGAGSFSFDDLPSSSQVKKQLEELLADVLGFRLGNLYPCGDAEFE